MSTPRITAFLHMNPGDPPVTVDAKAFPATDGCPAFHSVRLGDLAIHVDFDHLVDMVDQLRAYVSRQYDEMMAKDRADYLADPANLIADAAALTPGSTTGEAGMGAGDRLGEAVGKYRPSVTADSRPYDLRRDAENADALEIFREHQDAHR